MNPIEGDWPDSPARRYFEATMLEAHATELADRYPESIWPAGSTGSERDLQGARQAAFVAGIRFACDQLRGTAAEMKDAVEAQQAEATRAGVTA